MMFANVPNFFSVNSAADLSNGEYTRFCSEYQNQDGSIKALYNEYFSDKADEAKACDLCVISGSGDVLFADFLRLQDNSWRDCYGAVSQSIDALIPDEIKALRLIERKEEGRYIVHDGQITNL